MRNRPPPTAASTLPHSEAEQQPDADVVPASWAEHVRQSTARRDRATFSPTAMMRNNGPGWGLASCNMLTRPGGRQTRPHDKPCHSSATAAATAASAALTTDRRCCCWWVWRRTFAHSACWTLQPRLGPAAGNAAMAAWQRRSYASWARWREPAEAASRLAIAAPAAWVQMRCLLSGTLAYRGWPPADAAVFAALLLIVSLGAGGGVLVSGRLLHSNCCCSSCRQLQPPHPQPAVTAAAAWLRGALATCAAARAPGC